MIVVTCQNCKENSDPSEEGVLEINLHEGMMYFKCPKCKKNSKTRMYPENKPYPRIRQV